MTNTPKLLSREEIEAIRERLEHLKTCGALRANSVAAPLLSASLSDIPALLAHIEAQDALIGELAGILQDFYNSHPNSQHVYAAEKLLDKVEAMKEIGNDQTEEAR